MTKGLLFSGQGAQQVGMGKSLYQNSSEARAIFDLANDTLTFDLKKTCFEGPESFLTETQVCQPALYVHGYALYKILEARGSLSDLQVVLGLSLGELTALACAKVFDFQSGLEIVAERGRLMQEACQITQGSMASLIGGNKEDALSLCENCDVDASNYNCPGQIVISGEKEKILKAIQKAETMDFKKVVLLNVAGAYHSRLMQSARNQFEVFLSRYTFRAPQKKVFSNVTGKLMNDPDAIKNALVEQITSTVRWEDCMQNAIQSGVKTFFECGPGRVLAGLAKRIDRDVSVKSFSEFEDLSL